MAVGNILPEPESGWRRFDATNQKIMYIGDWFDDINSVYYNNLMKFTSDNTSKIIINTYCSKIRLVQQLYSNRTHNAIISIDGKKYIYNTNGVNASNYVVYENIELKKGNHKIIISSEDANVDNYLGFNCIDIDDDGYLLDISYMTKRIVGEHVFYGGIDSDNNHIESEAFDDIYNSHRIKELSIIFSKLKNTTYKILKIIGGS